MNYNAFQKQCTDTLLRRGRVYYCKLSDGKCLVSNNGHIAIVLAKKQIVFDLDLCEEFHLDHIAELSDNEVLLEPTDDYRHTRSADANRWRGENFNVWLSASLERYFDKSCSFYGSGELSVVKAFSPQMDFLGIIMPIRIGK